MDRMVGIVVPSYNQGKYLERTLCSIIENKKNIDIKLVVIDGGSTDESVEVIKKYEKEIDYWVSEKDAGQADAINKGLKQLQDCVYYMWLNSDDVYDDDMAVARLVNYAKDNNYEVCYGKSHYINENDEVIGDYPTLKYSYKKLGNRCYLSQPSVLFSRKAYQAVGELNVSLRMCLDYEYWIRLGRKFDFGYLEKYIGNTRIYADTKTSTMRMRSLEEGICILYHFYGTVPKEWTLPRLYEGKEDKGLLFRIRLIIVRIPGKFKNIVIKKMIDSFGLDIKYSEIEG